MPSTMAASSLVEREAAVASLSSSMLLQQARRPAVANDQFKARHNMSNAKLRS
jgi:hypothetical protein